MDAEQLSINQEELSKVNKNPEQLEAYQSEMNKRREQFISEQSPEVQAAFRKVDEAVKALQDLNIPYLLMANPFGWDLKRPGMWRFHRYSQNFDAKNETTQEELFQNSLSCLYSAAQMAGITLPACEIKATNKITGKTWFHVNAPEQKQ